MARPGRTTKEIHERTFFDPDTGEVEYKLEQVTEKTGAARQRMKEPFVMIVLANVDALHEFHFSGRDYDLMFRLIADMAYEEPFELKPVATLARQIGTSRDVVYQSLARFRSNGLLIDVDASRVLLNPRLFWKGRPEKRTEWIIMLETPADASMARDLHLTASAAR